MERFQKTAILNDLEKKKMVLLAGPRQAGKTWLAKHIANQFDDSLYLNYDQFEHRQIIQHQDWLDVHDLIIFDELHKMPDWKNYLKGLYDTKPDRLRILVTGSARLDIYSRVGDSLAGRYFLHRLMPLSQSELTQMGITANLDHLIERGGFPEAYLAPSNLDAKRWRAQYTNSLLSTDIFDFDGIHNVKEMRLLFELLRRRVGSPISYQGLAEDIAISPKTVKRYISILESMYVIFRVTPYSKNIARSLLKSPKIYFFDTGLVIGDDGVRFENVVAISLLKSCYAMADYLAEEILLHYIRTKENHEVDFALIKDDKIQSIIEVKLTNNHVSQSLCYFKDKYDLPATQVVKNLKQERKIKGVNVMKAERFLDSLFL